MGGSVAGGGGGWSRGGYGGGAGGGGSGGGGYGSSNGSGLIQASIVSKTINGTAWLWNAANIASNFNKYDDVGSLAAQGIIGNVCNALNAAATVSNGYDLYMNRDRITNGDIVKFGVDASITVITMTLALSNPIGWALTGIQIANTLCFFDPVYEYINIHYPRKKNNIKK